MSLETGPEQRIVVLGRLSGLYGVQGWLKVYSDTEPREGIIKYPRWWVKQQGSWREIRVEQGRRQGMSLTIARMIAGKFGEQPDKVMQILQPLKAEELEIIAERCFELDSFESFCKWVRRTQSEKPPTQ